MTKSRAKKILTQAYLELSDESLWCKGALARNSEGAIVDPNSHAAKSWCMGAIIGSYCSANNFICRIEYFYVGSIATISYWNRIPSTIRGRSFAYWNDRQGTDRKTMLAYLRIAMRNTDIIGWRRIAWEFAKSFVLPEHRRNLAS